MDLQLTTNEARVVRDALSEYATIRTDALHRADGSPGHPRFPEVYATAMRMAARAADRVRSRLAHKIELADGLTTEADDHGDVIRFPTNALTVALGPDHNIYIETNDGRRLIITDIDHLSSALAMARMRRTIDEQP